MNKKKIGSLLKKRRKELMINQFDLSEITGIAVHTISDIESGKGNPTLQVINKICDVLGMEILIEVRRKE